MARNKHPEETVLKILDTAEQLFIEKGYDKASLQDIITRTNLSKGAIYHHFTSKEDIFYSVCDRIGRRNAEVLAAIRDDASLNGLDKLKAMFKASLQPERQEKMFYMMPYLLNNEKFLTAEMQSIFREVVPDFVEPVIRQGIADGSIHTDYPKALAEAMMLLSDIWVNPIVQPAAPEEIRARCAIYNRFFGSFGIAELFSRDLVEQLVRYAELARRPE